MFGHLIRSDRHWSRVPWIVGSFVFHGALIAIAVLIAVREPSQGTTTGQEYTHLVFMAGLRPPSQPTGATQDRPKTIGNSARPLATPSVKHLIHEVTPPDLPVIPPAAAPAPPVSGMQVNSATPDDGTEASAAGNKETIYVPGGGMIPAALVSGIPLPLYPIELASNKGTKAVVEVQYVIDTLGQVEKGSIRVVSTPHVLFAAAVRTWLEHMARFKPAQLIDGTKVRQLAIQDITFVDVAR